MDPMHIIVRLFPLRYGIRAVVVCCLWAVGVWQAYAQNDPQVSMYWAVPTSFNPAMGGQDSALHVSGFNRMQWVGVKNAPRTFFFGADMPFRFLKKEHGAGVLLMNDNAGLFSTTSFALQYVFNMRLWGGRLSAGIQLGGINQSFAGGNIYIPDGDAWDPSDDALPSGDVSAMAFDCGFGACYSRGMFYGGISALHLTAPTLDLDEFAYSEMARVYYFNAGGNIPIKRTLFILQPSILAKTTFRATQIDWTLRATYDNRFWGGLTYRHGDAIVLMAGVDINHVRIGYAYDIGTSALAKASGGSHELMATYTMKLDLGKKDKHKHKSIRIL